jgi:MtN3 and saliva related transmembrane protein
MNIEVSIIIKIWVILIGLSFGVSEIFQMVKIIKSKHASGVSLVTWSITLFGQIQWLLYGAYIKDIPIIITNIFCVAISLPLVIILVVFKIKYDVFITS